MSTLPPRLVFLAAQDAPLWGDKAGMVLLAIFAALILLILVVAKLAGWGYTRPVRAKPLTGSVWKDAAIFGGVLVLLLLATGAFVLWSP